jgi:ATP-dependent DNA helicase RecG
MIGANDLQALLADMESDRIERTVSTTKHDKFGEAICAFANDYPQHNKPGYLLIGVKDDGSLAGLEATDELLLTLAAIRSDGNVLPPPELLVERHNLPGGDVVVVEVQPSLAPPVRYRGRVWIRVGPRRALASEVEERRLSERRSVLHRSYDLSPAFGATLADVSLRLFEDYRQQAVDPDVVASNHRSQEERLASLRCYDLHYGLPTVGGILLFGVNPRFFLPGAYVQFLRFPGPSMTERPIDELEISGDLRSIAEVLRHKVLAHNHIALTQGEGFRDRTVADYPEWALRELLHNAIIHRDYQSSAPIRFYWFADRIEIQSPGGLYGGVTATTMTKRNSYRNPVLAEAMKSMGYVNRYGYGIQRAQQLLQDAGQPAAEFDVDDGAFLVTVRRRAQ